MKWKLLKAAASATRGDIHSGELVTESDRALAAIRPQLVDQGMGSMAYECPLPCQQVWGSSTIEGIDHTDNCAWARADRIVAALEET